MKGGNILIRLKIVELFAGISSPNDFTLKLLSKVVFKQGRTREIGKKNLMTTMADEYKRVIVLLYLIVTM